MKEKRKFLRGLRGFGWRLSKTHNTRLRFRMPRFLRGAGVSVRYFGRGCCAPSFQPPAEAGAAQLSKSKANRLIAVAAPRVLWLVVIGRLSLTLIFHQ